MVKTPIVILHGWQVPVERYFPLKKLLVKKGFRVLIPQLPGFRQGETLEKVYFLDDYLKFVNDFLQRRKIDQFLLIGHSFGGRVAIKLACLYPEKVKGLILTGVPVIRKGSLKRFFFLILAKIGKIIFFVTPLSFLKNKARKAIYFLAGEWDYFKTKGTMGETLIKIVAEDLLPFLSEVKVPTLLIWGEKDKVVPISQAEKIVRKMAKAELVVIANATHKLPYEKPEIFLEKILQFFPSYIKGLSKKKRSDGGKN